jgi:diacylglycerol O-acyltransferase / wax synthase
MHRLSALDAQFLAAEDGNSGSQYCGLAIYQTGDQQPITAATMRQRLAERMGQCPPLRWKLVTVPFGLDRPVFVDSEVNLEDHVCETTLAAPADETTLAAEVADILSSRLDRDKPLWKLTVIHGLPGRTAVVTMLHHAAVDGIAAGEIFASLLDGLEQESSAPEASRRGHPDGVPSRAALVVRGIASIPGRRVRALRSAPATLAHLDQVPVLRSLPGVHTLSQIVRGDLSAKRLDAPRTRFNAKLSPARSVAFGTVSLSDVKAIKNELGVTVNDVVIALCAGALRRRLTSTGDLPADPLVAYIPVSTRLPDAQNRYGNAISSIIAPIPTHLSSARERLTFTHETLTRAKQRAREAPPTLMSDVNDPIPVPIFGIAARGLMELVSSRFVRPPVNLIISNVPGSPVKMACYGAPLLAHYPMSLVFDGFALNITVVSYQDRLDVGIVGDAQTLPDAWDLINDIRHELAELSALVTTERSSD